MILAALFLISLLIAPLLGVWLFQRFATWSWLDRLLAALSPIVFTVAGQLVISRLVISPLWKWWNSVRLAPTYALLKGYDLYTPADSGPVTGMIYGAVSALIYLPAMLAPSVTGVIIWGTVINAAVYFFPVLWVHLAGNLEASRQRLYAAFAFAVFVLGTLWFPSLRYCAFAIHADASALGFGGAACAGIYLLSREQKHDRGLLILSASCAVLAVWCKQSALPLLVALPLYLWLADGWPRCRRFLVYLALIGAGFSGLMFALFGFKSLLFNVFVIPARHPWVRVANSLSELPFFGQQGRLYYLFLALQFLLQQSLPIVLVLTAYLALISRSLRSHMTMARLRQGLADYRWLLFVGVGILMIPIALLGRVKYGGDINAFGFVMYFWLIPVTLAPLHLTKVPVRFPLRQRLLQATVIGLAIFFVLTQAMPPGEIALLLDTLPENFEAVAYQFSQANPGVAYFPYNPLPVLMAEGKLYHFGYGVHDRDKAGFPIDPGHFRAHIPPNAQIVAFPPTVPQDWIPLMMVNLPEYSLPVRVEELQDWRVFAKPVMPSP